MVEIPNNSLDFEISEEEPDRSHKILIDLIVRIHNSVTILNK